MSIRVAYLLAKSHDAFTDVATVDIHQGKTPDRMSVSYTQDAQTLVEHASRLVREKQYPAA